MATKITTKQIAEEAKNDAQLLITQTEDNVHSLRRIDPKKILDKFGVNGLSHENNMLQLMNGSRPVGDPITITDATDGVSPSVSVENIPRGHRITITDATHPASNPLSFDVLNGTDGQGAGDMTKQIYDPTGKEQDVFAYVDAAVAGKGTYSKPSGGIPKSDLADGVQGSLDAADSAYQKPSTGIPKTDLASTVQTSLGKADTAYQKPSTGIPKSALASAVQTSLGKADTALQTAPVSSVDGKTGAVSTYAETTVSLTAAGWAGSSAPYSQQVPVTDVSPGKIVILDLNLTAGQTDAAALEAWNNICKYGQTLGSGTITFFVDTKPSAAVSVRVGVIG